MPEESEDLNRRAFMATAGIAASSPLLSRDAPGRIAEKTRAAQDLRQAKPLQRDGTGSPTAASPHALHAADFGVLGDGRTDDTVATQTFLDYCAANGERIAHFGALSVRITGPLTSRGVGIVFDPASYGGVGAPGFVAYGQGYTALTVSGCVADFSVTLTGGGGMDITAAGKIEADRRPRINGISFGTEDGAPFAMSTVRNVRVSDLAGFGVRHTQCWDTTFLSVSVQRCGGPGIYAFEVAGSRRQTCNETVWLRVQVEEAIGGAIRIDPGTLSCSFVKIHSERAVALPAVTTWLLGGSCTYDSVRLTAFNPSEATVSIISNQADFRMLRAEGGIRVTVNASGGTVNFHNPGAVFHCSPDQNGIVNILGGTASALALGAGWNFVGCQIAQIEIGYMPPGLYSTLSGCVVGELRPQPGATQGELVITASRVSAVTLSSDGRLRGLMICNGSEIAGKGQNLACADQSLFVDASSRIVGNVSLTRSTFRLAGEVTGNLSVLGPVHDVRADDGAVVHGVVTGWGAPSISAPSGAWSANLAATTKAQRGVGRDVVIGWRSIAGEWYPERFSIER